MQVLVFRDVSMVMRFLRRNRDKVVAVLVIVDANPQQAGALKRHYGALILSGIVVLGETDGQQ